MLENFRISENAIKKDKNIFFIHLNSRPDFVFSNQYTKCYPWFLHADQVVHGFVTRNIIPTIHTEKSFRNLIKSN